MIPRPTVRAAVEHVDHAVAYHERQRTKTDPELAADHLARHEDNRRASMVDRHEKELKQQEGAFVGFARHVNEHLRDQDAALVIFARALGIEEKLPPSIRRSGRPPPLPQGNRTPSKPPPPKLETIEKDAKKGAQATYVTLATTIALIVLEALRLLGGGHGGP